MIKAAVLTQYFPTSVQPWMGHSAYQTLRLLARRMDLHVFYPDAAYPAFLKPKSRAATPDPDWNPPDLQATYIPYPVLPVISRPLNGLMVAARLESHIRRFQPDVLLNYVVYPDGYAAVRIGRSLGVPTVLTAIGSDLNRIPNRMVGHFTRKALREASFVTAVSHDLARTAVRLGARESTTRAILNGCDTAVFHPQSRQQAREALRLPLDAPIVVYVGRLDLRKGLAELVEAISTLLPSRPGLKTYLAGDGPDGLALRSSIVSQGLTEAVHLVPACPSAQVAQWMAAADLVTLPSYMEGCPNVIIEALSAGRPVVATRVGGIPELMDERSGRLVPPRDSDSLAAALGQVLDATWSADEIAARHQRSWADVADDLYTILEEAIASHSSGLQRDNGLSSG